MFNAIMWFLFVFGAVVAFIAKFYQARFHMLLESKGYKTAREWKSAVALGTETDTRPTELIRRYRLLYGAGWVGFLVAGLYLSIASIAGC